LKSYPTIKNKLINKNIFIFDFDGVIVDSMISKGKSFCNLFDNLNAKDKKMIINYHLENGSLSREKKIRYIINNILKINLSNIEKEKFITRKVTNFKLEYEKMYLRIKLVKGIKRYLNYLNSLNKKIFIVSSAPLNEIRNICINNDILKYFHKIYDNKKTKNKHFNAILSSFNNNNLDMIYFGDSLFDFKVASFFNIDFCSVLTNPHSNLNNKNSFLKLYDFR